MALLQGKMGSAVPTRPPVCGMNPYSSPLQVYYDKTGKEIPGGDKESMRQGRDLEDYVARRFMKRPD